MCRLLTVTSEEPFQIQQHLEKFSSLCQNSKEFQGHGWGVSFKVRDNTWKHYKNIKAIWDDDLSQFSETTILISHARSAFEDRDIRVENNMPFYDDESIYIFNGELRGVRIREEGRIGAEKIYNHIKRFKNGNMERALEIATKNITRKSRYVRAMNIIMWYKDKLYVNQQFNEDPGYFTLKVKNDDSVRIICSESYPDESGWESLQNNTIRIF